MLVAGVSMALSMIAAVAGIGSWRLPYQLRLARVLHDRYGMVAARAFYMVLALLLGALAVAIVLGVRPSYAR